MLNKMVCFSASSSWFNSGVQSKIAMSLAVLNLTRLISSLANREAVEQSTQSIVGVLPHCCWSDVRKVIMRNG